MRRDGSRRRRRRRAAGRRRNDSWRMYVLRRRGRGRGRFAAVPTWNRWRCDAAARRISFLPARFGRSLPRSPPRFLPPSEVVAVAHAHAHAHRTSFSLSVSLSLSLFGRRVFVPRSLNDSQRRSRRGCHEQSLLFSRVKDDVARVFVLEHRYWYALL